MIKAPQVLKDVLKKNKLTPMIFPYEVVMLETIRQAQEDAILETIKIISKEMEVKEDLFSEIKSVLLKSVDF